MADESRAPVAIALAVVALDALSLGLVLPVLPTLVAQISHGSASQTAFYVGALFGLYAFMQFLFSPVVGALSDRVGRRPVMLASLTGLGLCTLLWVWVGDVGWLFALRLLSGLFAANVPTASAYIADVSPPEKRAQNFGLVGAMFGIGFILGPVVGGLLGQVWIRLPFLVAAVLIFGGVLFGLVKLPESLPVAKRRAFDLRRANPFAALRAIGGTPDQKRLIFVWCCLWLMVAAHQAAFILSNQVRFGWNMAQNGLVLGVGGVFQAVVMALLVARATKRFGERDAALIGLGFAVLTYAMFAFATGPWIVLVALVPLALSTLSTPTVQAMLSSDASEDRHGEVQGALSSLQALMLVIGPLSMGALFAVATRPGASLQFPGAPFLAAAVLALVALLVLSGLRRARSSTSGADALLAGEVAVEQTPP